MKKFLIFSPFSFILLLLQFSCGVAPEVSDPSDFDKYIESNVYMGMDYSSVVEILGDPLSVETMSDGKKVVRYHLDLDSIEAMDKIKNKESFIQGVVFVFDGSSKLIYMEFSRGSLAY